jgi:hypothetical protein
MYCGINIYVGAMTRKQRPTEEHTTHPSSMSKLKYILLSENMTHSEH